jgi:integron integrase
LHYSYRTEQVCLHWIRFFIRYRNKRHPREMGQHEVEGFLTFPPRRRIRRLARCCSSTNKVLGMDIGWIDGVVRAKRPERVPVVLSGEEVARFLARLPAPYWLMASLMYGAGLRVMECLRLRTQDIDFGYRQMRVRNGKGGKDRIVPLPDSLHVAIGHQIEEALRLRQTDLDEGFGEVSLPDALDRKYPKAPFDPGWWYVFPPTQRSRDPYSGRIKRHHMDPSPVQKAMKTACRQAGIIKRATPHMLRHYVPSMTMSCRGVSDRFFQRMREPIAT